MSYGPFSYFTAQIASGATLSSSFDLQRAWENVYLRVPTMTSNTEIYIKAAASPSGTFSRVYHPVPDQATGAANLFIIISSVTNALIPLPNGLRYLKVETTATVDGGATFTIVCGGGA